MIIFQASGGIVTIPRLADQNSRKGKRRGNVVQVETASYDINYYVLGPVLIEGTLIVKYLTKTQADNLENFLTNTIQFVKPFTLTPYSELDLGAGKGIALTQVYLDGSYSTFDIIKPMGIGGKYEFELKYKARDLIGVGATGVAVQ